MKSPSPHTLSKITHAEAHPTLGHGDGDRAPCNPPSLYPSAAADTSNGAGLSRRAVLGVHVRTWNETTREINARKDRECQETWRKQRTAGKVRHVVVKGGGFEVEALKGHSDVPTEHAQGFRFK